MFRGFRGLGGLRGLRGLSVLGGAGGFLEFKGSMGLGFRCRGFGFNLSGAPGPINSGVGVSGLTFQWPLDL